MGAHSLEFQHDEPSGPNGRAMVGLESIATGVGTRDQVVSIGGCATRESLRPSNPTSDIGLSTNRTIAPSFETVAAWSGVDDFLDFWPAVESRPGVASRGTGGVAVRCISSRLVQNIPKETFTIVFAIDSMKTLDI